MYSYVCFELKLVKLRDVNDFLRVFYICELVVSVFIEF